MVWVNLWYVSAYFLSRSPLTCGEHELMMSCVWWRVTEWAQVLTAANCAAPRYKHTQLRFMACLKLPGVYTNLSNESFVSVQAGLLLRSDAAWPLASSYIKASFISTFLALFVWRSRIADDGSCAGWWTRNVSRLFLQLLFFTGWRAEQTNRSHLKWSCPWRSHRWFL